MANVWVGDNYYITKIYVTDSSYLTDTRPVILQTSLQSLI